MKKQFEKPEVKVMKLEAMDVIATSMVDDVPSVGVTMSKSKGFMVTDKIFE